MFPTGDGIILQECLGISYVENGEIIIIDRKCVQT